MIGIARLFAAIYLFISGAIERRRRVRESMGLGTKNRKPDRIQAEEAPPRPPSVCDCIRAEHRRLERHADRMRSALLQSAAVLDPEASAEFEQVQRMSTAHFEKERKGLYPRLQPAYPDLLLQMEDQHKQIVELARQVEESLRLPPEARGEQWLGDFRARGIEWLNAIQRHFVREEDQLLRPADRELSAEDQQRLAAEMNATDTPLP